MSATALKIKVKRCFQLQKYEVILTYKCNWNCSYCAVNTHNNFISDYDAFKKLEKIPEGSDVTISGGELGMLDKNKIIQFIQILNLKKCDINLNSNGLFIKKYPDLLHKFKKINYHCSENLNLNDEILKVNHKEVDYILIVHDENIEYLDEFLKKHNTIFCIIPATTPKTGIKTAPILSKKNSINILKKYNKYLSIESKKYLLLGKDYTNTIFL